MYSRPRPHIISSEEPADQEISKPILDGNPQHRRLRDYMNRIESGPAETDHPRPSDYSFAVLETQQVSIDPYEIQTKYYTIRETWRFVLPDIQHQLKIMFAYIQELEFMTNDGYNRRREYCPYDIAHKEHWPAQLRDSFEAAKSAYLSIAVDSNTICTQMADEVLSGEDAVKLNPDKPYFLSGDYSGKDLGLMGISLVRKISDLLGLNNVPLHLLAAASYLRQVSNETALLNFEETMMVRNAASETLQIDEGFISNRPFCHASLLKLETFNPHFLHSSKLLQRQHIRQCPHQVQLSRPHTAAPVASNFSAASHPMQVTLRAPVVSRSTDCASCLRQVIYESTPQTARDVIGYFQQCSYDFSPIFTTGTKAVRLRKLLIDLINLASYLVKVHYIDPADTEAGGLRVWDFFRPPRGSIDRPLGDFALQLFGKCKLKMESEFIQPMLQTTSRTFRTLVECLLEHKMTGIPPDKLGFAPDSIMNGSFTDLEDTQVKALGESPKTFPLYVCQVAMLLLNLDLSPSFDHTYSTLKQAACLLCKAELNEFMNPLDNPDGFVTWMQGSYGVPAALNLLKVAFARVFATQRLLSNPGQDPCSISWLTDVSYNGPEAFLTQRQNQPKFDASFPTGSASDFQSRSDAMANAQPEFVFAPLFTGGNHDNLFQINGNPDVPQVDSLATELAAQSAARRASRPLAGLSQGFFDRPAVHIAKRQAAQAQTSGASSGSKKPAGATTSRTLVVYDGVTHDMEIPKGDGGTVDRTRETILINALQHRADVMISYADDTDNYAQPNNAYKEFLQYCRLWNMDPPAPCVLFFAMPRAAQLIPSDKVPSQRIIHADGCLIPELCNEALAPELQSDIYTLDLRAFIRIIATLRSHEEFYIAHKPPRASPDATLQYVVFTKITVEIVPKAKLEGLIYLFNALRHPSSPDDTGATVNSTQPASSQCGSPSASDPRDVVSVNLGSDVVRCVNISTNLDPAQRSRFHKLLESSLDSSDRLILDKDPTAIAFELSAPLAQLRDLDRYSVMFDKHLRIFKIPDDADKVHAIGAGDDSGFHTHYIPLGNGSGFPLRTDGATVILPNLPLGCPSSFNVRRLHAVLACTAALKIAGDSIWVTPILDD
jgi:hypothetical protein